MKRIQNKILERLATAERVLLMGHRDPDGDSAGSLMALAGLLEGPSVYCYSDGRLPQRYRFLDPEKRFCAEIDPAFRPDVAVALEAPARSRLGRGVEMLSASTTLINIDHHRDNELYGDINWVDPEAAALGEMIYTLIRQSDHTLTSHMATCLYTAILTDTGRFHYPGTSSRTLQICSELVTAGADPNVITQHVYFGLPFAYLHLMHAALDGMERVADGRVLAFTLLPEHFERAGAEPQDSEGIVDLTLLSDQIRIGILFRSPEPGRVKVSFRSQDSVDVGSLAAEWGGGGHRNASGCVIEGDFADVKPRVLQRAAALLEGGA